MTCKKCGMKLSPEAQFCIGCGTSMSDLRENNLIDETDSTYVEPKTYGTEEPFVPKNETMLDNTIENNQVLEEIKSLPLEEITPEMQDINEEISLENNPQAELLNKLEEQKNNKIETQEDIKPKKNKRKKKNPFVIILLVLLMLLSLAGGFYFMFNTPTNNNDITEEPIDNADNNETEFIEEEQYEQETEELENENNESTENNGQTSDTKTDTIIEYAQSVYRASQQQYMSDELDGNISTEKIYCYDGSSTEKSLSQFENSNYKYYIKYSEGGYITEFEFVFENSGLKLYSSNVDVSDITGDMINEDNQITPCE